MFNTDYLLQQIKKRQEGFSWLCETNGLLRWATSNDLNAIINIEMAAFPSCWSHNHNLLRLMWAQKIDDKTMVVVEDESKISGFFEVLWGYDTWRLPHGLNPKSVMHEWIARKLLCNSRYSLKGPYLFTLARHPQSRKGVMSKAIGEFLKHHEFVSTMYLRSNSRLDSYYKSFGFYEVPNPLPWGFRHIVEYKYIFALARTIPLFKDHDR